MEIELIIKIISLIFIIFNLLILITICKMHIKQISIREGYFNIIFTQIIIESLLNATCIVAIVFIMIFDDINYESFYIMSLFFNFFYNVDILYNVQTILYLKKAKNKVDKEDIYSHNEDLSRSEDYNRDNSIDLKKYSFRRIHFTSLFFTLIQSFIYSILYFEFHDDGANKNNGMEKKDDNNNHKRKQLKWYFYFIGNNNLFFLIIFSFNYLFVFFSITYCFLKQTINESIKLKNYSIYCFLSSIIGLMFPTKIIISQFIKDNDTNNTINIIYSLLFLIYLLINSHYRVNCYYVQSILSKNGRKFCKKLKYGLTILFTNEIVYSPNFIDFNNSFIYHSLASEKDFSFKKVKNKKAVNIDDLNNTNSESFSFTLNN